MRKALLGSSIALVLVTLIAGITLPGCSEDPAAPEKPVEQIDSYEVVVPEWVRSSTPFPITVVAIGTNGSKPLTTVSGTVSMSVPQGTINPVSMTLASGQGTDDFTLIGVSGTITITVSSGSKIGTGTIQTVSPDSIAGGLADDVAEAIPDIDYVPRAVDFSEDHPQLTGASVSHNTLLIAFTQGTTIGQANQILDDIDGAIVGGLPGIVGSIEGVVIARLPTTSHAALAPVLATLESNGMIASVFPDVSVRGARIAAHRVIQEPYDWVWNPAPAGGNWGLELLRVPQLWNLNDAVAKSGQRTSVAVLDYGFPGHPDLDYFSMESGSADHGAMIAGIIAAEFSNRVGVDGIAPFSDLAVDGLDRVVLAGIDQHTVADNIQAYRRLVVFTPNFGVINLSTCYGWCAAGIDAGANMAAQNAARQHGEEFKRALRYIEAYGRETRIVVAAAGNDSDEGCGVEEAMFSSPWCNAALDNAAPTPVVDNILVVEALELDGTAPGGARRALFSNIGGHLSAPGVCIRSTAAATPSPPWDPACDIHGHYKSDSGTSFAAPHVAGLVSYLLSVEPTLSAADIKDILTAQSVAVGSGGGTGAAKRIDAWATVMDIDRVTGSDKVLRMWLDIDDGTPDGNQRLDHTGTVINFDTHGDGNIDMSDFRRWRDWYLQIEDDPALDLDGDKFHSKKDPNGSGDPGESTATESIYPRGDFNGDGKIDTGSTSYVPGAVDATVTDLEVLESLFSDDNYDVSELPALVASGDMTIAPTGCLSPSSPDVIANGYDVVSSVTPMGAGMPSKEITHSRFQPAEIFTVAPGQYQFAVQVRDGLNIVSEETLDVTIALGGDDYWAAGNATTGCIDTVAVREIKSIAIDGSPGNHGLSKLGDFDGNGAEDLARIGRSIEYADQRAIYFTFLNTDGTLAEEKVIEARELGYDPSASAPFKTVSAIGDVDRDGIMDIAVGVFEDTDLRGAIWIVTLTDTATIKAAHKITGADLGCATCSLGGGTNWVAPLGDLNNDLTPDIAVSWGHDDGPDELVVIFLRPNGEVRSATDWGSLTLRDNPIASIGDLDNDGIIDLAYSYNFFFGTLKSTFLNADGSEKMGAEVFSWPATETILSLGGGGDLDGDMVPDVLVTTLSPQGTGSNVWAMLLNADGTLKSWSIVNHPGKFIWGATVLGDLDGDNAVDIAILDQSEIGNDTLFILFGKP